MTNTRHIPDLQAAEECISQAITAVKRHDPAFVDQCVTAALQYLQPDVEHVTTDKPRPEYQVNVTLAGEDDPSTSAPMSAEQADETMSAIDAAVTAGRGIIQLPRSHGRQPLRLNGAYIGAWWLTEVTAGPPF